MARLRYCCAVVLGLSAGPVLGEPLIEETREYYEFQASTREQIWRQIASHSPKGNVNLAGHHAVNVAVTEWRFDSRFRFEPGLRRCRIVDIQPRIRITIRMPHWVNKWEADEKLVADWDRYVRMVSEHEDVHRNYAIAMVKDFYQQAQGLGEFGDCQDARDAYETLQRSVAAEYQAKNKWFDAQDFVYQKQLKWF